FALKKRQLIAYLQGLAQVTNGWGKMRRKQREMRQNDCLTTAEFASCLQLAERSVVDSIMRRRRALGKGNWLLRVYGDLFCPCRQFQDKESSKK
ncbi:MAG: hypothetical protein D3923_05865, partial [Candidatus Electrothrix sp. AR3]|nr:hypothetical protein [Candidatus Electrothrix sp. AR3]